MTDRPTVIAAALRHAGLELPEAVWAEKPTVIEGKDGKPTIVTTATLVDDGIDRYAQAVDQALDAAERDGIVPTSALRMIAAGGCESSTEGIGACYRNGRTPDAQYGAERCCAPCIAARGLGIA